MPVETKSSKRKIIDIILLVVLLIVVAGAWFIFVNKTNKDAENRQKAADVVAKANEPQTSTKKIQNLGTPIFLQISTDTSKLPSGTDSGFVAIMKERTAGFSGCKEKALAGITIDKISDDFVRGAVLCNGGTVTYWYKLDGSWKEMGVKNTATCAEVEKAKIPVEFLSTCLDKSGNEIQNPVGIYR